MQMKGLSLILVLVSIIWARPQDDLDDEDDYDDVECSEFEDIQKYPQPELRFRCVPNDSCAIGKNKITLKRPGGAITAEEKLLQIVAVAEAATCPDTETCCHKDDIKKIEPQENKCSDIDGYRCVASITCKTKEFTEENNAFCSGADTRSVGTQFCCKEEDELVPKRQCTDFPGRRCVSKEKCQGNKVSRRSGGLEALLIATADNAECPDEEICCAEGEITQECSDYSEDGYKCAAQCYDIPQDFPSEYYSEITPFLPKEAKCPPGQICCQRTEKIIPESTDKPCEENGDEYECLDFDECHPDTFLQSATVSSFDALFQAVNLIESSSGGGLTINTAKSPCKHPTKVCCKPLNVISTGTVSKTKPVFREDDLTTCLFTGDCTSIDAEILGKLVTAENEIPQPAPYTNCGQHNKFGLQYGGVPVRFNQANGKPVTSQEGEWPHTCLILKVDEQGLSKELVGGASLIAPKVIITAAHKVGYLKPEKIIVRCGDWNIADTDERFVHQDREVMAISKHPLYLRGKKGNLKLYNDIALVHTKEAFEFAPNVNTICLPDSLDEDNFSEENCHTMGWGTFNEDEPVDKIQDYMKKVVLNRIPQDECEKKLRASPNTTNNFELHESFICAGGEVGEDKDVCKGDGGGPLVCKQQGEQKFVLAGIISWGIGCGDGIPGVYASVRDALCFIDWDTKCKHGLSMIGHYDYRQQCTDWMNSVTSFYEDNSELFERELKKLNELKATCKEYGNNMDEIWDFDIAELGGRTDGVSGRK